MPRALLLALGAALCLAALAQPAAAQEDDEQCTQCEDEEAVPRRAPAVGARKRDWNKVNWDAAEKALEAGDEEEELTSEDQEAMRQMERRKNSPLEPPADAGLKCVAGAAGGTGAVQCCGAPRHAEGGDADTCRIARPPPAPTLTPCSPPHPPTPSAAGTPLSG